MKTGLAEIPPDPICSRIDTLVNATWQPLRTARRVIEGYFFSMFQKIATGETITPDNRAL